MTPDRIRQLSPGFAVALTTLLFVGCSSGGGGTPQATVQGAVVDGYVRGATVTLYGTEGFAGPAALATATTDANGDFVLTLPAAELPGHFALLSKGGTIIDTGMPAPTMAMVAMRERDRYYVTPLTDRVTRQGMRAASLFQNTFVTAEEALAAELGLTPAELYDDPLAADAPAGLTDGLDRSLAAGDQTVALPDGEYLLRLVFFDKNDIGNATFTDIDDLLSANKMLDATLNIANGVVTGTIDDTDTVTGRIQGPSLVLSLEYPDGVVRVAGTVGLLGSLSGTYVDFDDGLPDDQKLSSGVFVASLIPAIGIDSEGLKKVTETLYAGERNLLFRDLYGDRDLGWGAMGAVSLDADAGTITAPEFDVTLNAAASVSDTLSFVEGKLVTLDDGTPAGLAVMHFTDSGGDHAYLIQALGNRRGVYVAGASDGNIYAIGESYLARSDALGVDLLTANEGESMKLAVSNVNVHMLGETRDPDEFVDTSATFTVPSLSSGSGAAGDAAAVGTVGVQVVSGSMLGLKYSAGGSDTDLIDDDEDFLAIAEMHPTGALQGDIMDGGNFAGLGPVIDAADWPVPLVGFAAPASADPSLVDTGEAQLDFIARPLYTIDPDSSALISLVDYKLAVISGTIRSQDNSATLTYRDNEGEAGTLALTVENRGGVYHLHGPMGDEYIDILWGAGGTRAVFVSSTQADGNGTIYEIGEAFLSY